MAANLTEAMLSLLCSHLLYPGAALRVQLQCLSGGLTLAAVILYHIHMLRSACPTRCIEFLRLTTNKQRQLAIGNSDSTSPLITSTPVASKGVFLAFFKGFTDEKMKGARTGLLQQLQITWAQRTCNTSSPATPTPPIIVPPTPTPTPAPVPAKCTASALMGCSNGEHLAPHDQLLTVWKHFV